MFVKTCPDAIAFEKTVAKRISSILYLRLLAGIKNEKYSNKCRWSEWKINLQDFWALWLVIYQNCFEMFSIFNYMCHILYISEINILAYNEIRFYTYSTDSFDFLKCAREFNRRGPQIPHIVVNKSIWRNTVTKLGGNANKEKDWNIT